MHKKLITACLAAFALAAIALPVAAQATNNPTFTHPTGTVLATGSTIEGTNIGDTLMRSTTTDNIDLRCSTATLTGTITENNTGAVKGEISSATFKGTGGGETCTGFINPTVDPLNLPWCLKANNTMGTDEFTITGAGCGVAAKKLEFTLTTGLGKCRYQATKASIRGSFRTHAQGDATGRIPRTNSALTLEERSTETGFTKVEDTIPFNPCPSSDYLEMEFTLETDGVVNSGLWISS